MHRAPNTLLRRLLALMAVVAVLGNSFSLAACRGMHDCCCQRRAVVDHKLVTHSVAAPARSCCKQAQRAAASVATGISAPCPCVRPAPGTPAVVESRTVSIAPRQMLDFVAGMVLAEPLEASGTARLVDAHPPSRTLLRSLNVLLCTWLK